MTNNNENPYKGCFQLSLNGCCTTIILIALTVIAVTECQRSRLRLHQDMNTYPPKYVPFQQPDSTKQNTTYVYTPVVRSH